MAEQPQANEPEIREDFPIDTFRYLEERMRMVRNKAMCIASVLADARQPDGDTYTITKEDVDAAIVQAIQEVLPQ